MYFTLFIDIKYLMNNLHIAVASPRKKYAVNPL